MVAAYFLCPHGANVLFCVCSLLYLHGDWKNHSLLYIVSFDENKIVFITQPGYLTKTFLSPWISYKHPFIR